ncbi:MAG: peptidoglycan-binding protein [Phyllobacterium sp.]
MSKITGGPAKLAQSDGKAGGFMKDQRSILEQVNANRTRRNPMSIEELNRTLAALESRLNSAASPRDMRSYRDGGEDISQRFNDLARNIETGRRELTQPQPVPSSAGRYDRDAALHETAPGLSAITQELKQLRQELRAEMSSSVRREFDILGRDMQHLHETTSEKSYAPQISAEIHRVAEGVRAIADRDQDESLLNLRGDLEELKRTVQTLAREDSLDRLNHRWDSIDERLSSPDLATLEARLEQIRQAVETLPQSLSISGLEDKVRVLSNAVEQVSHRSASPLSLDLMQQLDERLDEISRAILASTVVSKSNQLDAAAFERLEARISAIAARIEDASEERATDAMLQRMEELAERIDLMAERNSQPDRNVRQLAEQIGLMARYLESVPMAPVAPDFAQLEDRLQLIMDKLDVSEHHQHQAAPHFIDAIDRRFEELTHRLDRNQLAASAVDTRLFESLDERFEDLARHLTASTQVSAPSDSEALRNLEFQVAELSRHLSNLPERSDQMTEITPRLDAIEQSIATNRDAVLDAAREAAEYAIRNLAQNGNANDAVAVEELANDLKSLEVLARKSDDRNTKTFEAIHDTLLKIVDRLGSLEGEMTGGEKRAQSTPKNRLAQTPALDFDHAETGRREPVSDAPGETLAMPDDNKDSALAAVITDSDEAPHAAPAARRKSLFSGFGLGRKGLGRKGRDRPVVEHMDPTIDLADDSNDETDVATAIDPELVNQPLEPGSGKPDLNAILKRVREERRSGSIAIGSDAGKADYIAAARRAAQAAATEAETLKAGLQGEAPQSDSNLRALFNRQRKPILMAIGAIIIAIAGIQMKDALLPLGKSFMSEPSVARQAAPTPEKPVEAVTSANTGNATPRDDIIIRFPSAAAIPAPDMTTVGSLQKAPPTAEANSLRIPSISDATGPVALREAAEEGDPKALFEVGNIYTDGRGVPSDMSQAVKWYEASAGLGYAPAQYRLGNFYEKGLGVARDLGKAKTWYQLAAEQGNASAMHNLAVLFASGLDGAPDNESAERWFIRAAELGVKDSQFNLGILTAKGFGMPQNLEESYKWFAVAAKSGDADAAQKRDEVAKAMDPQQLERARAAAELWKPKPLNAAANTLDIPDAWKISGDATASVDMKKAVQNIQLILNKNGYDAGNADGMMGDKTKQAIAAFQKANGMKPTGEVDRDLVRVLLEKNG